MYGINYSCKKFYKIGPKGLYHKTFYCPMLHKKLAYFSETVIVTDNNKDTSSLCTELITVVKSFIKRAILSTSFAFEATPWQGRISKEGLYLFLSSNL